LPCRSSAEKKEEEEATPDMTWLFDAAREGRVEPILEYAQSENPNLDVRDSDGNTLLHWAVLKGKTTLVSALVDHGVDINALNTRGVTALFYASMLGDGSMVSLLV
jgi:ankyrin repeat protein